MQRIDAWMLAMADAAAYLILNKPKQNLPPDLVQKAREFHDLLQHGERITLQGKDFGDCSRGSARLGQNVANWQSSQQTTEFIVTGGAHSEAFYSGETALQIEKATTALLDTAKPHIKYPPSGSSGDCFGAAWIR